MHNNGVGPQWCKLVFDGCRCVLHDAHDGG
jgi:hypothetical protein